MTALTFATMTFACIALALSIALCIATYGMSLGEWLSTDTKYFYEMSSGEWLGTDTR